MNRTFDLGKVTTDREAFDSMIDSLTVSSMKANYIDFVTAYGSTIASEKMENVYKDSWTKYQTDIWQWFDDEMKAMRDGA